MKTVRRWLTASLVAFVMSVPAAFAQTSTAIEGTVSDATGGALPGATVDITNAETNITRSVVTDDEGRYRARDLPLGEYRVAASLSGFQSSARSGIILTLGRAAVVDFQLGIGELTETVEVTGDAPLVNTSTAAVGGLIAREQMADLPLNSRDFSQLITLQPGTVQHRGDPGAGNAAGAQGARISISGARPSSNRFVLDGTEIQTAHGQLPSGVGGVTLGLEAVQEFQVLTSSYSAQRGRSVGGTVVAATRSGTNTLRGSAYLYHRNEGLDASNFFDRGEKPEFTRNQFGGGVGGPIVRNRTFFFFNHERLHEKLPQRLSGEVPTEAARQGILPGRTVVVSPLVRPYLDLFPLPNGRDFGDGTAEYFREGNRPTDHTYTSVRIDHQFGGNNSIFGRYTRDFSKRTSPTTIELFDNDLLARNQYGTIEWNRVMSSRLVNQLRVSLTRTIVGADIAPVNEPDPSLSNLDGRPFGTYSISGVSDLEGSPSFQGYDIVNAGILGDDLTLDLGRHSIHVGGAFTQFQYNRYSPAREGGLWEWGSLADFLQNNPPTRLRIMGPGADSYRSYRQRTLNLYVQDDLRFSDRLTLNMGLRYDFTSSPTESHGRLSNLRNILDPVATVGEPYYRNPGGFFSPRFGLAWDPTGSGKTSVRAGAGLFHEPLQMKDYVITIHRQSPFWLDLDLSPSQLVGSFPDLDPIFESLALDAPQATHVFEFEPNNPYSVQMSLTVQRQIAAQLVVEVGYTGTRGIHLPGRKDWAVPERTVVDGETFFPANAQYINPVFTRLHTYDTSSSSWYHGFRTVVTKRFSDGLHFQTAYTLSKVLDINSALIQGELGGTTAMDPYDSGRDWGLADFDARHVFTGSASYMLPWGRDLRGIAGALAGGWQVSGIFTATSGTPFTVSSNPQLTHPLLRSGSRPDLVPGGNPNPILGGVDQYFDPLQFVVQQRGFFGNLGRNTLIGPGLAKLDFSLMKAFSLGGERRLQARIEMFNALNRANFRDPSSGLFNARGARLATAGRITSTSTTARQMQLALRFEF
jgi:hypothetical protein